MENRIQTIRQERIARGVVRREKVRKAFDYVLRNEGKVFVNIVDGMDGGLIQRKEYRRFPRRHVVGFVVTYPSLNGQIFYSDLRFEVTR